jgi:hypothetical protein
LGRPGGGRSSQGCNDWRTTLQRAVEEIAWVDTCGRGLDKKRHGIMINLAKAFPEPLDDEEGLEAA